MVISIETEKALDEIQHPFMTRALNKLGKEGMYLNIIKVICDKPITNMRKKLKPFALKSRMK
jgi:hypothetical protein